jgi:hypothetical protein
VPAIFFDGELVEKTSKNSLLDRMPGERFVEVTAISNRGAYLLEIRARTFDATLLRLSVNSAFAEFNGMAEYSRPLARAARETHVACK